MRLLIVSLLIVLAGCDRQSASSEQAEPAAENGKAIAKDGSGLDRSHAGEALPNVVLIDPDGNRVALNSLKGKPILLNLWATWCAPCVKEMPTLDALAAASGDKLVVIPASQDSQPDRVAPFWKDKGFKNLRPWLDPEAELYGGMGIPQLPATIYYGADGKEQWRYVGDLDWMGDEAKAMLAGPSPAAAH